MVYNIYGLIFVLVCLCKLNGCFVFVRVVVMENGEFKEILGVVYFLEFLVKNKKRFFCFGVL